MNKVKVGFLLIVLCISTTVRSFDIISSLGKCTNLEKCCLAAAAVTGAGWLTSWLTMRSVQNTLVKCEKDLADHQKKYSNQEFLEKVHQKVESVYVYTLCEDIIQHFTDSTELQKKLCDLHDYLFGRPPNSDCDYVMMIELIGECAEKDYQKLLRWESRLQSKITGWNKKVYRTDNALLILQANHLLQQIERYRLCIHSIRRHLSYLELVMLNVRCQQEMRIAQESDEDLLQKKLSKHIKKEIARVEYSEYAQKYPYETYLSRMKKYLGYMETALSALERLQAVPQYALVITEARKVVESLKKIIDFIHGSNEHANELRAISIEREHKRQLEAIKAEQAKRERELKEERDRLHQQLQTALSRPTTVIQYQQQSVTTKD